MRIEGQKKMGFYPTPDSVVELARSYLDFGDAAFNVLDPCCGKGNALSDLIQGTKGLGYGVEINEKFVPVAKQKLFKVARGGYESARITNSGFSKILHLIIKPARMKKSRSAKSFVF
jgi:SAM-dependent methyltransferase